MTTASEVPSIPDLDVSIDASTLSIGTAASSVSRVSNKKSTKNKGRSAWASKVPEVEVIEVEPGVVQEVPQANNKYPRGSKRTSDLISEDDRGYRESTVKPERPMKRRNTGTRGSVIERVDYPLLQGQPESMAVEPVVPKPARGGTQRAFSRNHKTSAASMASLRAGICDNAAVEAELEADLDRPTSDEEKPPTLEELPKKRGRKPKVTGASTALVRGPNTAPVEHEAPESETQVQQPADNSEFQLGYNTDVEGAGLGRSKSTRTKTSKKNTDQTKRTDRGSAESTATIATELETQFDSSVMTSRTDADDSGHGTDASVGGRSVVRKGSKRKATSKGRGKKGGTGVMSKNIEDILQSQSQVQTVSAAAAAAGEEASLRTAAPKDEEKMDMDRLVAPPAVNVEASSQDEQAQKKATRTATKARKAKPAKSKKQKASDKPSQLSMPGAFSPLMPDQEPDMDPSFASVLSPTSPPLVAESTNASMTPPSMRVIKPPLPPRSPLRNMNSSAHPTPTPQRNNRRPGQRETTPSPSPQSSDAENAPPSTRPPSTRPPLAPLSPSKNQITRIGVAPGTPRAAPLSPSKTGGGLKSDVPWTSVDVETVFATSMPRAETGKENGFGALGGDLTSPEKKMTVEEWINWNARKAEEELRAESERVVGVFEKEGGRALRVLEGIEVSE
jgi:hypothetical protein